MLKKAKNLLWEEYHKNYPVVKDSPYYAEYADEKIRHSLQVLGAGNYIIRHEPWFDNRPQEFVDTVKTAVLLHDIARFDEIRELFLGNRQPGDHSLMGCEKLRRIPEYDNILITLPIKHHGHLIEDFYADPEYRNIVDPQLKEQVEKVIFAIRDADKIANFNLIMNDDKMLIPLFVPTPEQVEDKRQRISPGLLENFWHHRPLLVTEIKTQADYMLSYIGWLYDINYRASMFFCRKLNLVEKMFDTLQRFHNDLQLNKKMRAEINDYIKQRFGV